MSDLLRDVRFAVRTLARTPAFTWLSVLTMALGIGVTTAVFSMVNGALVHRLPYASDRRLVRIAQPTANTPDAGFSVPEIRDYQTRVASLSAVSEYHSMPFQIYGYGEPQRVLTGVVSDNFFNMLGVKPLLGRLFLPGEEAVGAPNVLVLGHRYWKQQFGGDPNIIGTRFRMNDRIATVVGVLPPLPAYPDDNDIWMPAGACPFRSSPQTMSARQGRMLNAFATLAPGRSLTSANSELQSLVRALHASYPEAYPPAAKFSLETVPLRDELTRSARPLFLTLLASALFVLVVATANFANLTLSRQLRRSHELALRTALGAGRGRLFRQLATESLVITTVGGAIGVGIAYAGLGLLRSFASRVSPRASEIGIDGTVLAFAVVVSVTVGLIAALVPLARRADKPLADELRAGAVTTTGSQGYGRARSVLVALQVAVAFVILAGAGLLVRSLAKLQSVDGGYETRNVLTARVDLNWSRYTTPAIRLAFGEELLSRLASQPGVVSVAVSSDFPLNNGQPSSVPFQIRGQVVADGRPGPSSDVTVVSPEYFKTVGVPLVRGRVFTSADRDTSARVALISRRLAATFWPTRDPIGDQITVDGGRRWLTIVGVVGDVHQNGPAQSIQDEIYLSYLTNPSRDLRVLVRTNGAPSAMATPLRNAVRELDDKQPVVQVQTLDELRGARLAEPRVTTALLLAFGLVALVITAGGLAGVVGYSVTQRISEIGIRLALGADAAQVLWLVLRGGVVVIGIGLIVGLVGAMGVTRLMSGLLFTVTATDPITYAAVAVALFAIGVVACMVPARRAMRVDPVQALRTR